MEKKKKINIVKSGVVVSTKADKTVSVDIERRFRHPVYKKIVKRKKKYMAHDEKNQCRSGDLVRIQLVRPISQKKRWLVTPIISKAPEQS